MNSRFVIQLSVSVGVLVFALGVIFSGGKPNVTWLDYYSYAATAAVVAYWLWDRVVWRWPISQRLKIAPRNISGTWQGVITSFWSDLETNERLKPKTVYLVIRQTSSQVSVTLLTDQARSASYLASLSLEDGTASLDYLYSGSSNLRYRQKSPIHNGSCSLSITGVPAMRLKGSYWTDRNSSGELDFTQRVTSTAEDFNEAEALFATAPTDSME